MLPDFKTTMEALARNEGERVTIPPTLPNHWGAPKNPNNSATTFFNAVNLLPKNLSFEHGGAKLVFFPRAI